MYRLKFTLEIHCFHIYRSVEMASYFRYITMAFPLGNLAALRTFRVLRALKTVAVVPGELNVVNDIVPSTKSLGTNCQ